MTQWNSTYEDHPTSSSSSSDFQSTVPTCSTNNETSKDLEGQSNIHEDIRHSEKEQAIFTNQNCLDQTHIIDSNDEMEETDCITNILDNAGHTGRVSSFQNMGLGNKMDDITCNMNITCGELHREANAGPKISGLSNTLHSPNKSDLILEPTTAKPLNSAQKKDDTFSDLFAIAGIKKKPPSVTTTCGEVTSIASDADGHMEMTCQLPSATYSTLRENILGIKSPSPVSIGMEMTCQLPLSNVLYRNTKD